MLRTATLAVLGLRVAYGAALIVAPERLALRWLGPAAGAPPTQVPLRGLGAREIVIHGAAIAAALQGKPVRPFLAASATGDVADIVATVAGRRGLPDGAAPATRCRCGRVGAAHRGPRRGRRALSLAFDRAGTGPVLVLLHPLGADRHVWAPVMERLTAERDVIAVDLPGFGESTALNGSGPPTPAALAAAVAEALPDEPYHVAGNSLGGWVALELAAAGHARSVTAIAPAGLWPEPLAPKRGIARALAKVMAPGLPALVRSPAGRRLALASTVAHAERVPPEAALRLVRAYADAPGFEAVNRAMRAGRFTRLEHSASRSRSCGPSTTGSSRDRRTCRRPSAACRSPMRATSRCGTRPTRSPTCCSRAAGTSADSPGPDRVGRCSPPTVRTCSTRCSTAKPCS